ncbi:MAG: hypothetical protein RR461_01035 [Angelakisella sp.]
MFGKKKRSKKQQAADVSELGIVCAAFGFVILFVAMITPILHILEQNKRLQGQHGGRGE